MSQEEVQSVLTHCLSFDIEEHFQVAAFDSPARRRQWNTLESRVEHNTEKILHWLETFNVKATMFVLGWIGERYPGMVRQLAAAGHEIASHGYGHELISVLMPNQFREDVRKAKQILEDVIGQEVKGYRAPTFSITHETLWALQILIEEGYAYDSSIFPVHHDQYGMPGANPFPHLVSTSCGPLWEVPPSTCRIAGIRVPIAGGGYFRLMPYWLFSRLLRRAEREGEALVMYFHPWEFDTEQPKMSGPFLSRFRHYLNLNKAETRLLQLLQDFRFAPIRDVIAPIGQLYQVQTSSQTDLLCAQTGLS